MEEDYDKVELNEKIATFYRKVSEAMLEGEELVKISMLTIFAKENLFMYGPPGAGKTYILKFINLAFPEMQHFKTTMSEFRQYDDIYGEKITGDDGLTVRAIDKKLPTANSAFLDEIWKGPDAILNTLLDVALDKKFENGVEIIDVPLYFIFSASNEFPRSYFLKALFDRFPIRIPVLNVKQEENIMRLIDSDLKKLDEVPQFKMSDIDNTLLHAKEVKNSDSFKNMFISFKKKIEKKLNLKDGKEEEAKRFQISNRTIVKFGDICRISAYLNLREETDISELILGKYIFWSNMVERKEVWKIMDIVVFGDLNSFIETLDEDFVEFKKIESRYKSHYKTTVEYLIKLSTEKKYLEARIGIEELIKDAKETFRVLDKKHQELEEKCKIEKAIEENVFIDVKTIPYRIKEVEIKKEVLSSMDGAVEQIVYDGTYYDKLSKYLKEITTIIEDANKFLTDSFDYFDYEHNIEEKT